jgi:hypothetical protein
VAGWAAGDEGVGIDDAKRVVKTARTGLSIYGEITALIAAASTIVGFVHSQEGILVQLGIFGIACYAAAIPAVWRIYRSQTAVSRP